MSGIKKTGRLGLLLLGIWLILYALMGLFHLHFDGLPTIMSALAGVAGLLILIGI